jgi:Domain of unknown function (DUF222)
LSETIDSVFDQKEAILPRQGGASMSVTVLPPLPGDGDPSPGSGSGFGWGQYWDRAEPGPLLAGAVARICQRGLGRLSADELVGLLMAVRRVASWAAAMELAAVGELAARRRRAAAASGAARAGERIEDELAAALGLTPAAASRVLELATAMARLPATAAALRAGWIDRPRAAVIADELRCLSDADAIAVDLGLAGRAADLSTGQLRVIARRQVLAADPDAARRRREKAERQARVRTWAEPNGTGALAGRDLPPAAALAADRHVSALARALQAAGSPGTADQLRAQVFTALLTGHPVSSLLTAPPRRPAQRA